MPGYMVKVALVTGGNSGIGKATAFRFAQQGYRVAIAARRTDLLEKVQHDIAQMGAEVMAIAVDVTQSKDVTRMVQTIIAAWGTIDVLIHAAGIAPAGTILDTDEAIWDAVIDTNLKGTFLVNQAVLSEMLPRKQGSIVNIASDAGVVGARNLAAYCASKGGVVLLTKATALDFAREGIRVNALCPGPVETPMTEAMSSDEMALWKSMLPIQRFATADEVADAAYFLAHSEFATGSCLLLDGGNTAGGSI
jgi:NAD(P)-dependent dehydrogenase (short-subunit alcohol dehydrogenase family)